MAIRPLGDRVIVAPEKAETTTKGGIVIPDTASKEKPVIGVVVAIGPGKLLDNGDRRSVELTTGDRVLFGKYAGTETKVDGDELVVLREDDIIGVVG